MLEELKNFMKRNNFLRKLKIEEKLGLVEPSEEICDSYFG